MAPRAQTIDTAEELDTDDAPVSTEETEIIDAILSEFAATADDVRWKIAAYRLPTEQHPKETFLFDVAPHDLNKVANRLLKEYRTGDYQVRVYRNGKLFKRIPFSVETPAVATVENSRGDLSVLAETMDKNFARLVEMMTRRETAPVPVAAPDPFMMLERMTTIMRNLQPATPAVPAFNPETMTSLFVQGMELGFKASGKEETGMLDVLKEVAGQLPWGEIISGLTRPKTPIQMPSQSRAPIPHTPGPSPQEPTRQQIETPSIPQETNGSAPAWFASFKPQLDSLVNRAQNNSPPDLYAEMLLDTIPREQLEAILQIPNLIDEMAKLNPAVNQVRPWFQAMLDALTNTGEGADDGTGLPNDVASGA